MKRTYDVGIEEESGKWRAICLEAGDGIPEDQEQVHASAWFDTRQEALDKATDLVRLTIDHGGKITIPAAD